MDFDQARLHNLLLRVYQVASKGKLDINECIKEDELKKLYFRQYDFLLIGKPNPYFDKVNGCFKLKNKAKEKIIVYIRKHEEFRDTGTEEQYIKLFKSIEIDSEQSQFNLNSDDFNRVIDELLELAPALHWKHQPEYEEYLLINSGIIPEDNLNTFYNHYHRIEDLYWVLTKNEKKKKIKTMLGDVNLNQEFDFKVYSQRWGHYDNYLVKRTLEGWEVNFLMTGGKGDKEGSAIIYCLEHDSITYPVDISSYFRAIWKYADNNYVKVDKIRAYMQKVGDWISTTEKKRPKLKKIEL